MGREIHLGDFDVYRDRAVRVRRDPAQTGDVVGRQGVALFWNCHGAVRHGSEQIQCVERAL
jgi:hypothetical protein